MIVKNETRVLPRLFRSLVDYIDYYVIVDTGSTDDTIALILREMTARGIEGVVHERAWVNFGFNRQQALELALEADKADWLLFIDADEELGVSDSKFYEKLKPGISYNIEKHHSGTRYALPQLVNIRASSYRWEGPVHNHLVTLQGEKKRPLLKDLWIVYHPGEGAKSHGVSTEEKYLRDASLLEEDLLKHPDNARNQFYLGQSYKDAGHLEQAYEAYGKRVLMKGWVEENFMAQLEKGRLAIRLEKSEEIVVKELLSAYTQRPTRAEPLFELARYFRLKKSFGMAYLFAKAGIHTKKPTDSLFVTQAVYDWQLLDEFAIAAYWVEDYAESKRVCERLLEGADKGLVAKAEDRRRIHENLAFAARKLSES